jgi:hypothetical protein
MELILDSETSTHLIQTPGTQKKILYSYVSIYCFAGLLIIIFRSSVVWLRVFKQGFTDFPTQLNAFIKERIAKYQILIRYFDHRNKTIMLFRNVGKYQN